MLLGSLSHFDLRNWCAEHVYLNMVKPSRLQCASIAFARFFNLYPSIRDPLPALHTKPAASDLTDSYPNPRDHISKPEILSLSGSQVDVVCGPS
jgi:hypothetical protein